MTFNHACGCRPAGRPTQAHLEPTPEQIAETALHTGRHIRRCGLEPNVALCAASRFGSQDGHAARTMQHALALLHKGELGFEVEGEMDFDVADEQRSGQRVEDLAPSDYRLVGELMDSLEHAVRACGSRIALRALGRGK